MFLQSMITTLPTPAPAPTLRHLYQLILFEREYYISYEGQCRIVREGSDANCHLNRKQENFISLLCADSRASNEGSRRFHNHGKGPD